MRALVSICLSLCLLAATGCPWAKGSSTPVEGASLPRVAGAPRGERAVVTVVDPAGRVVETVGSGAVRGEWRNAGAAPAATPVSRKGKQWRTVSEVRSSDPVRTLPALGGTGPGPAGRREGTSEVRLEVFGRRSSHRLEVGVPYAISLGEDGLGVVLERRLTLPQDEPVLLATAPDRVVLHAGAEERVLRPGWTARLTAAAADGRVVRVDMRLEDGR